MELILPIQISIVVKKHGGSKSHTHTTGNFTLAPAHLPAGVIVRLNRSFSSAGNDHWWTGLSGWANYENGYGTDQKEKPHNHGNTGSSSNVQPYYTCYIFRRTK